MRASRLFALLLSCGVDVSSAHAQDNLPDEPDDAGKASHGKRLPTRTGALKASTPGRYSGSVTDPHDDRAYSGRATLAGDMLKLTGRALRIFCQTETWARN